MKESIITKFGSNHKGRSFPDVTLSDGTIAWSFYTFRKNVYIMDNVGMDNNFDDYPEEDQTLLYNRILEKSIIS
jgi:hypothetical protein